MIIRTKLSAILLLSMALNIHAQPLDREVSIRDSQRRSLRIQFIDGFFHVSGRDGVVRRFPYQNIADAKEAAFDIAGSMADTTTTGEDPFLLIPDYFNAMTFNGPRTIQNIQNQNILRETQRSYCQGSNVHSDLSAFCTHLLSNYDQVTQDLAESLTLLRSRKSNCLGEPLTSENMRSVFNIVGQAMAAENIDINDSYCNATTGMLGVALNQLGLVRGEDYQITHGENHVFMTVPNSNTIIDPTYLQFLNRECPIFQQLQPTPGFLGTREELKTFFISNKSCFRALTPEATQSLASRSDDESWWTEVERLYYGTNTTNTGFGKLAQDDLLYNEYMIANHTYYPGSDVQVLLENLATRLAACNNEEDADFALRCHQNPRIQAITLGHQGLEIGRKLSVRP